MPKRLFTGVSSCIFSLLFLITSCLKPESSPSKVDQWVEKIESSINKDAWDQTNWVSWSFAGRRNYVWDRSTNWVELKFENYKIVFPVDSFELGYVFLKDSLVEGENRLEILEGGYGAFCNDSFWLNAPSKLKDPGVELGIKDTLNQEFLSVSYTSGGVTPGDTYFWETSENGLPSGFYMNTQILTSPWVYASWENYDTISSGAIISTLHLIDNNPLTMEKVYGGDSFESLLLKEDPFKPFRSR